MTAEPGLVQDALLYTCNSVRQRVNRVV